MSTPDADELRGQDPVHVELTRKADGRENARGFPRSAKYRGPATFRGPLEGIVVRAAGRRPDRNYRAGERISATSAA